MHKIEDLDLEGKTAKQKKNLKKKLKRKNKKANHNDESTSEIKTDEIKA